MTASQHELQAVLHSHLAGNGDGMQVMEHGEFLYVGHFGTSGAGTTILDRTFNLVRQWPSPRGVHTHKVQTASNLLLTNHERFRSDDPCKVGMSVYDIADPFNARRVGWFDSTGKGVHRIVWNGGEFAYVSMTPAGFNDRIWAILDMSDPTRPSEVGRWWWPGQWLDGGEASTWPHGRRYAAHHALVEGKRAYLGYGDAGLVILDITDPTKPVKVSNLMWSPGGDTHTCLPLPGRDVLVVTDESTKDNCEGGEHLVRTIDIADEEHPVVAGICPPPQGNFCERGLRFGPHNLHENQPGSYRSNQLVFVTYFNAGLRVYDVSDPCQPFEIAHWVPETPSGQKAAQINDVFVTKDHRIFVTDRINGGVYLLRPGDVLSNRMREAALSVTP